MLDTLICFLESYYIHNIEYTLSLQKNYVCTFDDTMIIYLFDNRVTFVLTDKTRALLIDKLIRKYNCYFNRVLLEDESYIEYVWSRKET